MPSIRICKLGRGSNRPRVYLSPLYRICALSLGSQQCPYNCNILPGLIDLLRRVCSGNGFHEARKLFRLRGEFTATRRNTDAIIFVRATLSHIRAPPVTKLISNRFPISLVNSRYFKFQGKLASAREVKDGERPNHRDTCCTVRATLLSASSACI